MTIVVMLPSLRVIKGPEVFESFARSRWGKLLSSKRFPMIGKGLGPGGIVWLASLEVSTRIDNHTSGSISKNTR